MISIWNAYLYDPMFNLLIWLYNGIGLENLGLAVISLTILVRVVLIPFSFIAERNQEKSKRIGEKWKELTRDIPSDLVLRRELIRAYIKEQRTSPWARIALLGVQLLVLVLLYQVFLGGFAHPETFPLYSWMTRPDFINTSFFGLFDVADRNIALAALSGVVVYIVITLEQRRMREAITRQNLWFRIFFPLASAAALAALPSVKSLFILTSILFSAIFHYIKSRLFPVAVAVDAVESAYTESTDADDEQRNPWDVLRK
jgi:YidC/Oxa1 family membrane protein insertase